MKNHEFLLALLLVVLSCGSSSPIPNVVSKGEPKRERRILFYDSAAIQSLSYLDQEKVDRFYRFRSRSISAAQAPGAPFTCGSVIPEVVFMLVLY